MIDLDRIADELGLDLAGEKPEPARPSPPLSTIGAAARDELQHHLSAARALLEMGEATLSNAPENDHAFDAIDGALAQRLVQAGEALAKFRALRACRGTA